MHAIFSQKVAFLIDLLLRTSLIRNCQIRTAEFIIEGDIQSRNPGAVPLMQSWLDAVKEESTRGFIVCDEGLRYWLSPVPTKQRLLGETHISHLSGFLQIEIGASFHQKILVLKFYPCQKYPLNDPIF